jgi:hypothetical protein
VKVPTTASRNSWKSNTFASAVLTLEESMGAMLRTIFEKKMNTLDCSLLFCLSCC